MKELLYLLATTVASGSSAAALPAFAASCPLSVNVEADHTGVVRINGAPATLKKFNDSYYEARRSGVTISVTIEAGGTPTVSYTGPGRANGICTVSAGRPGGGVAATRTTAATPSFDCGRVERGSVEAAICGDEALARMDRHLAEVFAQASAKSGHEHPPTLRAEQRGWIKARNECLKSGDRNGCIAGHYRRRTAELQARYRLVTFTGPVFYTCDGDPHNEVTATFFPTDPPVAIVERGDSVSVMYSEPSGSGARYVGRNESLWEHHGEAVVTWGFGAPEMRCIQRR